MIKKKVDVVVLGAGLTGLSTAHFLKKAGKSVIVLEKENRVGGSIHSFSKNGFLYESGPNTGVVSNVETVELFDDLHGTCEIEIANPQAKKRLILKDNTWHALPSGLKPAIETPLFTLKDKIRILGEPFRSRGKNEHESLEDLVLRRIGRSFYDYAVDPFVSGIYAGDPQKLIPKYALPKLYNLEQQYGSFVRGALKKARMPKTKQEKRVSKEIFSAKGGLVSLIKALEQSVGPENILLNQDEYLIEKSKNGYYTKITNEDIYSSSLVSTISPDYLRSGVPFIDKFSLEKICDFDYAPVIQIAVGFKHWNGMPLDAFGGLIPSKEKKQILGILFMSALLSGRAPEHGALFSTFVGGMKNKEIFNISDSDLYAEIEQNFKTLMGLHRFNPDLFQVNRHQKAIPQYDIRSKIRFETIEQLEQEHRGLYIRGNIIDGIGMPDRIKQAKHISDLICI